MDLDELLDLTSNETANPQKKIIKLIQRNRP